LLTGQYRIALMETSASDLIAKNGKTVSGVTRSTTRTKVYTEVMRSELIVLQNELKQLLNTREILLDGRSESEYYGATIRNIRGGHISGASHSPLSNWRSNAVELSGIFRSLTPIVYAHDSFDSLVYLTALHTAGVHAKVYLPGWIEWAVNGELPVDSVSYPRTGAVKPMSVSVTGETIQVGRTEFILAATFILCAIVASFYTGRKFSGKMI